MQRLSFDIARRYLYGKKSTNSINIITGISIFGISIGTAALILILSVFNGFEQLLSGLFNSFNPDIKVLPYEGKYFEITDETILQIQQIDDVTAVSKTIEEVSLFEYKGSREIGTIKGVDEAYLKVTQLDSLIVNGRFVLSENNINYGIIGAGLRNRLSLSTRDQLTPVTVYMPQKKQKIIGAKEFKARELYTSGVFSVRSETDYQYLLSNIDFVRELLDQDNACSALEINLNDYQNVEETKRKIAQLLGDGFVIKNRYEQDETYMKIMQIEKWFSFLIAGLTMLLIAFNLVGALWMIVLDKQGDISVLRAMGYHKREIRRLFSYLGLLITCIGILLGFLLALIAYVLQKNYGIIAIPEGFLIDSYPVSLRLGDFVIVSVTVLSIGFLASILPAAKASRSALQLKSAV